MMRPREPSEGVVGKGLKRRMVEQRGERGLYTARKRRLARARTFPDAEAAKLGGANRITQMIIIYIQTYSVFLLHFQLNAS
jgi:hypothetical protein